MVSLSREEKDMIVIGLNMRRNYIETGTVTMSAADAKRFKEERQINALSTDQMKLIVKTEELITKILTS